MVVSLFRAGGAASSINNTRNKCLALLSMWAVIGLTVMNVHMSLTGTTTTSSQYDALVHDVPPLSSSFARSRETAVAAAAAAASQEESSAMRQAMTDTHVETFNNNNKNNKPYAYVWVIGAIDASQPAYKGFLYDIMISVSLLQKMGSTEADFWVLAQLSHNVTDTTAYDGPFPMEDAAHLRALGVKIRNLERPQRSSFAHLVYEKFHPLQFTQYRRILFLDADTIPLVNLDYLFRLSDPADTSVEPVLRPNMVVATRGEPCNTAFFMMHPEPGAYEALQRIVDETHQRGAVLPYPHFDFDYGWGHSFRQSGDKWEAMKKQGATWRFHAGHSDQGLWYYYAKYYKQDVSIVIGNKLQNIKPPTVPGGNPTITEYDGILNWPNHTSTTNPPIAEQHKCVSVPNNGYHVCHPILRDFAHFSGGKKPWSNPVCRNCPKGVALNDPHRLWFDELGELNKRLKMGLDVENFNEKHMPDMKESPLGYLAKFTDHQHKVKAHAEGAYNKAQVDAGAETNKNKKDKSLTTGTEMAVDNTGLEIENTTLPNVPAYNNNNSTILRAINKDPFTVAYAVSFIKCGDFQTHSAGLTDASLVLRHSVHSISKRNPASGSNYDYKMYAIVHRDAQSCSEVLKKTGFEVVVVDPPVLQKEIEPGDLRKNIHKEWCCGADEFIKLYAYTLPEEIVVHVDIDFAFYKPMDDLFDAMIYDKDSAEGKAARQRLLLEFANDTLPDRIDAFFTRDWPQVAPFKWPGGYQAGFIVARRDPSILDEMAATIRKGNYTSGWGWNFGWGNAGYGGWIGAMAMQGFVAYFYDHIRPGIHVELNQCRFNHMGMDVLYRKPPNFRSNIKGVGGCRTGLPECEDCMHTDMEKIYSVHYTMCRKPWQCQATGLPGGKVKGGARATAINTDQVDLEHCMKLVRRWHDLRTDLEDKLYALTGDDTILDGRKGDYKPDVFNGHCDADGNGGYKLLTGKEESYERILELYSPTTSDS